MSCLLEGCENPLPTINDQRVKYCSPIHKRIAHRNKSTMRRADEKGLPVGKCASSKCFALFVKTAENVTMCPVCRKYGEQSQEIIHIKNESPIEFVNIKKDDHFMGLAVDFRHSICRRNGKEPLCKNYSKCSDSICMAKDGAFEYQKNGGVDCWEDPGDAKSGNLYGEQLTVHKIAPRCGI